MAEHVAWVEAPLDALDVTVGGFVTPSIDLRGDPQLPTAKGVTAITASRLSAGWLLD